MASPKPAVNSTELSESRKRTIEAAAQVEANAILAKLDEEGQDDPLHIKIAKAFHQLGRSRAKQWTICYGDISPKMQKSWPRSRLEKYKSQGLILEDHKTQKGWLTAYIEISIRDILTGAVGKPACFNECPQRVRKNIYANIYNIDAGAWDHAPHEFIDINKKTRLGILKNYFEKTFSVEEYCSVHDITGPFRKKKICLEMCEIWKPSLDWDQQRRWDELRDITFD